MKVFGESFDLLGAQIRATKEAIRAYIDQGLDATDPAMQKMMENLAMLKAGAQETSEGLTQWQQVAQSSAETVGSSLAELASDSERSTKEIVGGLLREITALLVRQIVAQVPFPASLAVAAGMPAIAESLIKVTGFAHGGVVPPGHPNDTFPAMLSSGERVVPQAQADTHNDGNSGTVDVEGWIYGEDVYMSNDRSGRKREMVE